MKTYSVAALSEILHKHEKWLRREAEGKQADLRYANLSKAHLNGVRLYGASLAKANLSGAKLLYANLCQANLNVADLSGANLHGADLSGACLINANLSNADLSYADLSNVDFTGADLSGANTYRSIGIPTLACPSDGEFIAWKKAKYLSMDGSRPCIVKLKVIGKRSSGMTKKCRTDKAEVLSAETMDGYVLPPSCLITSLHDLEFKYRVGDILEPKLPFHENRWDECASGIHFFCDKQDAINY